MTLKAYKFRIYPNAEQVTKLAQTFGCVRFVWNSLVANFRNYGTETFIEKLSDKILKDDEQYAFLNDVSAAALQQKNIDFLETKKQKFNKKRKVKLGNINFKKKGISNDSYRLPNQKFRLDQEGKRIRLEKIGFIDIILDRKIQDNVKFLSVTVSKTKTGKYFASVLVDEEIDQLKPTGNAIGIDVGLTDFACLSTGEVILNPKWFRKNQAKLAKEQRHLSRKTKVSNRYNKQRVKVAKVHEKITLCRKYFLHNVTTAIVRSNDIICIENLNVAGMKKSNMAKSISDVSWSEFFRQLEYKSKWCGRFLVKIDRFYPSSQLCSDCGESDGKKPLEIREWTCNSCGCVHHRDHNAAKNILIKGYSDLVGISIEESSAELVDYRRGEGISLGDYLCEHLAPSVKRLDNFISFDRLS